jgi:tellurium resistance protein TerD
LLALFYRLFCLFRHAAQRNWGSSLFFNFFKNSLYNMALQLQKIQAGQRINLTKEQAGLKRIRIGLSWEFKSGLVADLDTSVVVVGDNGRMLTEDSLLYYNSPKNAQGKPHLYNGGLVHTGDERSGMAEGDDETILIDLSKIPTAVKGLVATTSIYGSGQFELVTFGRVKNATVKLYNAETSQALYQFDLTQDASKGTSVEMVRFFLKDGDWRFEAMGEVVGRSDNGLQDIVNKYEYIAPVAALDTKSFI